MSEKKFKRQHQQKIKEKFKGKEINKNVINPRKCQQQKNQKNS